MALPRFETIGFLAAVHKPMGDVMDVTSISFIQSMELTSFSVKLTLGSILKQFVAKINIPTI